MTDKKSRSFRGAIIMTGALAAEIAVILMLYPIFQSTVFAISVLPAICGGWLYGGRKGFLFGALAATSAFGCQFIVGYDSPTQLLQALLGGPLVILVGAAVGRLRDLVITSRAAIQNQLSTEESKRRLEKQLQQSQKMEAVGTLAGGVAHDMNNILAIIMSAASVLKHNLKDDLLNSGDVENILSACNRGRDLTRNLLGFARKGAYVKSILDINEIVEEVLRLLTPVMRKNIHIEKELFDELHSVHGDRSQIAQVLLNICINASEAIRNEGKIVITTRNAEQRDVARIAAHRIEGRRHVIIEIEDNGEGIDPKTLRHVFEPFFTTKKLGAGTGLGLSMAYGAMKNHGGAIDIESVQGKGTTLIMMLPALRSEHRVPVPKGSSTHPPRLFPGTILLVDDEPLIRSATQRLLRQLGYRVVPAESGEAALRIYKEQGRDIALVILDFVMPGMDGAETFQRLKELDPAVKVIISSGYSRDGVIDSILESGAAAFIQKPFDGVQIDRLLRRVSGPAQPEKPVDFSS